MAGYANSFPTPFGVANFWTISDLHFHADQAGDLMMSITLSGYPTETDANNEVTPMGTYVVTLSPTDIVAIFSGAQSLVDSAVTASDPAWAGATYITP